MQDQAEGDALDELGRARRRAFSREGTEADLERVRELEELERRRSDDLPPAFVPGETDSDDVGETDSGVPDPGETADRETPTRRRAWIRPAALGLVGGLLIGVVIATATNPLLRARPPESFVEQIDPQTGALGPSLAIFDRTPSERDLLGAAGFPQLFDPEAGTPEVRWLADIEGSSVYVSRGLRDGETRICLVIVRAGSAGGGCASEENFQSSGIGGTFEGLSIRWGPYGVAPWVPYEPEER